MSLTSVKGVIIICTFYLALLPHAHTQSFDVVAHSAIENITSWLFCQTGLENGFIRMNSFWRPVQGVSMHLCWVWNNIQFKEGLKYLKFPAGYYMFKVNNRNNRARCKICSKLTIETLERRIGFTFLNFINNVHENSLNFSV